MKTGTTMDQFKNLHLTAVPAQPPIASSGNVVTPFESFPVPAAFPGSSGSGLAPQLPVSSGQ